MRGGTLRLFLFLLFLTSPFASIARAETLGAGTLELRTSGDFRHSRYETNGHPAGRETAARIGLGLARSLHRHWMVGATALWDYQSLDPEGGAGRSRSGGGLTLDVIANLPGPEKVVPYLQVSVGAIFRSDSLDLSDETTQILPLAGAGVRVLVGEQASLNVLAAFENRRNTLGVDDANSTELTIQFGFSIFPGGVR